MEIPLSEVTSKKRPRTSIGQPGFLGSYERKADGTVHYPGNLRTFHEPPTPSSLNEGYEIFVPKENTSSLRPVLDALKEHKIDVRSYEVVTFRNNLNKIMATPYCQNDGWRMGVKKIEGVCFLNIMEVEGPPKEETDAMKRGSYWGYKFEQLCTESGEGLNEPVNPNAEFGALIKTRIGHSRLVVAAEIDCKSDEPDKKPPFNYIELKTALEPTEENQVRTWRRWKLLKFWIQSFLVGVPKVIVGWRDRDGTLQGTETLDTLNIPKLAKDSWDAMSCLQFTDGILEMLRSKVGDGEFHILSYNPDRKVVRLEKCDPNDTRATFVSSDDLFYGSKFVKEVRVRHILAKHCKSRRPSSHRQENITRTPEEALAKIKRLREKLKSGSVKFEEVAQHESDCSSYKRGGDLGFFGRGAMQPSFERVAFSLPVGQMSVPVETNSGFHIILRVA